MDNQPVLSRSAGGWHFRWLLEHRLLEHRLLLLDKTTENDSLFFFVRQF